MFDNIRTESDPNLFAPTRTILLQNSRKVLLQGVDMYADVISYCYAFTQPRIENPVSTISRHKNRCEYGVYRVSATILLQNDQKVLLEQL